MLTYSMAWLNSTGWLAELGGGGAGASSCWCACEMWCSVLVGTAAVDTATADGGGAVPPEGRPGAILRRESRTLESGRRRGVAAAGGATTTDPGWTWSICWCCGGAGWTGCGGPARTPLPLRTVPMGNTAWATLLLCACCWCCREHELGDGMDTDTWYA